MNPRLRRAARLLALPLAATGILALLAVYLVDSPVAWNAAGRSTVNPWLGAGLAFLQFIALGVLAARAMPLFFLRPDLPSHAQPLPALARHLLVGLVHAVAVCAGLNLVFGYSLETLLAASGIFSLVVGFALRGLMADIFSGIALHMDRNVASGDWLQFHHRGQEFTVLLLEFDWRCAILRDRANNAFLIPNSEFSALRMVNLSRPTNWTESAARISLPVRCDHRRVLGVLQNAANCVAMQGHVLTDPGPYVRMGDVQDGMVPYTIWFAIGPEVPRGRPRHHMINVSMAFLKAAAIPLVDPARQPARDPELELSGDLAEPLVRRRVLSQLGFFSALTQEELLSLATATLAQPLSVGHQVIRAGDAGDSMFVVLEGRLDVVVDQAGTPLVVATLWPGDCFGEMSLLTGEQRTASVLTREPTVLMEVRKESIADLFARNPVLMERFATQIETRQRATREKVAGRGEIDAAQPVRQSSLVGRIWGYFKLGRRPPQTSGS